jgi:hypothetical protein
MADKSLYERLGGAFAIAAVINYFSDEVVKDPVAGQKSKNSDLREGPPSSWADCRGLSSCERCGSVPQPAYHSTMSALNPDKL